MAKASIHINPIKSSSEIHNKRLKDFDYIRKDLSEKMKCGKKEVSLR